MAEKVKVYDQEGKEYIMESVDARECINHLGYKTEKPVISEPKTEENKQEKKTRNKKKNEAQEKEEESN